VSILRLPGQETLLLSASFRLDSIVKRTLATKNTSEFLAIIATITALAQLGISNVTLHLVGNSITSLAWSSLERFTGVLCQRASTVHMLLATTFNIRVASVAHISGTENVLCDRLSRYDVLREHLGYPSSSLCDCGVQYHLLYGSPL